MKASTMSDVAPGTPDETPFSPKFAWEETGLRIAAPPLVRYPREPAAARLASYVPLALTLRFRQSEPPQFDSLGPWVTVCAVDSATGASLCSTLQEEDYEPKEASPPRAPGRSDTFSTVWLNVDLARFLAFPAQDAVYVVHATMGRLQSNAVRIEVAHDAR